MNNDKRKRLDNAINLLNQAIIITEDVLNQEDYDMVNIPENLQMSKRYNEMESSATFLTHAVSAIDSAISNIEKAKG